MSEGVKEEGVSDDTGCIFCGVVASFDVVPLTTAGMLLVTALLFIINGTGFFVLLKSNVGETDSVAVDREGV